MEHPFLQRVRHNSDFDLLCSLRISWNFLFHPLAKPSSGATVQLCQLPLEFMLRCNESDLQIMGNN